MTYPHLPAIGALPAPEPLWLPSQNFSSRNGRPIQLLFIHRWGAGTFEGNVSYLRTSSGSDAVSAHFVYAGRIGPDAGKAAQLVKVEDKAWTECDLNPIGVSIETEDAIWLGHDPEGFAQLARMAALVLKTLGLPARYIDSQGIVHFGRGFTRHRDAGQLGCGHLYCPTTDEALWQQFAERVVLETRHGKFRSAPYGR